MSCTYVVFVVSGSSGVFGESGGSDDLFSAPKKQPVSFSFSWLVYIYIVVVHWGGVVRLVVW